MLRLISIQNLKSKIQNRIDSGRIIEIAKNKTFIKVKLKRHQRKDIKLTILSPPTEIKIRQLWRILCQEKEGHLHCIEAEYLSD